VSAPEGLLLLDKPAGITSHDLVNRVRSTLGTRKVGHAGTLDPMATGLMLVGVGRGTRLLRYLSGLDKTYEGVLRLGETTDTLDAPLQGVNYTIPFGMIFSIVFAGPEERGAQRARVTLHSGEELQLERTGDLGERNAGMLIFVDGRERPEYVRWTDVEQVDFDRPPAMYPPLGKR